MTRATFYELRALDHTNLTVVLADTSIWSPYPPARRRTDHAGTGREPAERRQVLVCGPVVAELVAGACRA